MMALISRARISGATKVIRGYSLLVLDPAKGAEDKVTKQLLAGSGRQTVYRDRHIIVIRQRSAGRSAP